MGIEPGSIAEKVIAASLYVDRSRERERQLEEELEKAVTTREKAESDLLSLLHLLATARLAPPPTLSQPAGSPAGGPPKSAIPTPPTPSAVPAAPASLVPSSFSPEMQAGIAVVNKTGLVITRNCVYGSVKDRVLAFINANPNRAFTAADVGGILTLENTDSVRTQLASLAGDDLIARDGRGMYRAKEAKPKG